MSGCSKLFKIAILGCLATPVGGQVGPLADVPYGALAAGDVKATLDRILSHVEEATPFGLVNEATGKNIVDLKQPVVGATFPKTTYGLYTHEWGLTYSAMLQVSDKTRDSRYREYVVRRFDFLSRAAPYFRTYHALFPDAKFPLEHFLYPRILDDTGSMCAAMIQAIRRDIGKGLRSEVDQSVEFIMNTAHRLSDGTFARTSPYNNTVWVDDLYQGIPALVEMGKLTGDTRYYDEACRQVLQFAKRLFDKDVGVCLHGWVEDMNPHPAFYWARANGWAILAIANVLDVLPEGHPQRSDILTLFQAFCRGLARLQSAAGFWHQLLDRNDSFLETSATAMFAYAFAHGINRGWLDLRAYGPAAVLGWHAVSTKVNAAGEVEGTSAGTSLAFDPGFYYRRPIGTGPHGYGSALLAGSAIYELLSAHPDVGNSPVIFRR